MERRALLTGATGLWAISFTTAATAGHAGALLVAQTEQARKRRPIASGGGDARDREQLLPALSGCQVAYYLVHGMGELTPDWVEREVAAADTFARAAEEAA